jgi:hypothetical protein
VRFWSQNGIDNFAVRGKVLVSPFVMGGSEFCAVFLRMSLAVSGLRLSHFVAEFSIDL